jgi:hypothetical protein
MPLFHCQRTVMYSQPQSLGYWNQVNIRKDVELAGIEPAASGLQNRRSPD